MRLLRACGLLLWAAVLGCLLAFEETMNRWRRRHDRPRRHGRAAGRRPSPPVPTRV